MNKRYWFVVAAINSTRWSGHINLGYVSDDNTPFSNTLIKTAIIEYNKDLKEHEISIMAFQEFKDEADYNTFFDE